MFQTKNTSKMKFCTLCGSFLYDMVEKDAQMVLKCRDPACTYEEAVTKENPIVYDHTFTQDTSIQLSINKNLKYDSRLPSFDTMSCFNDRCTTRAPGQKSQIVGVKLDAVNVVWMYQCKVCDTQWKQNAKGAKTA